MRVAHVPGMPGTFSPLTRVSDSDMHHVTCVTHVPWCMRWSLISGFLWSWWQGKCSRHYRRMRNLQFYVSGKRPMVLNEYDRYGVVFPGNFNFLSPGWCQWIPFQNKNTNKTFCFYVLFFSKIQHFKGYKIFIFCHTSNFNLPQVSDSKLYGQFPEHNLIIQ